LPSQSRRLIMWFQIITLKLLFILLIIALGSIKLLILIILLSLFILLELPTFLVALSSLVFWPLIKVVVCKLFKTDVIPI